MTIIRSPIQLKAAPAYVAARLRKTLVISTVAMIFFGYIAVAARVRRGEPLGASIVFTVITAACLIAIAYFITASMMRKWTIVLKPDDSIDVTGIGERTIRATADESVAVEQSPDGRWWWFVGSSSRKRFARVPTAAFPDLQASWQKMQLH